MTIEKGYIELKQMAVYYDDIGELQEEANILKKLVYTARLLDNKNYLIESLTEYGGLIKYLGRFKESEESFLEAKGLLENIYGESSIDYATCLVNLATLYRMTKEYRKSENNFLNAIKIYEDNNQQATYSYAGLCNNLALLYQDEQRYNEALELHKRNLAFFKGKEQYIVQYGTTLNNIATLYISIGEYEKAKNCIDNALIFYGNKFENNHPLYITALNTLANLYYNTSQYKKALEILISIAPICKERYGEESTNYRIILDSIKILENKVNSNL